MKAARVVATGLHAGTALAGESVMQAALDDVRAGHSDPDRLLRAITKAAACDGAKLLPGTALTAAVRLVQKTIEEALDVR